MKNSTKAIGQLKSKKTVYCSVCGQSLTRKTSVLVYENNPTAIEKAKLELSKKSNEKYTCRICKSILKSVA